MAHEITLAAGAMLVAFVVWLVRLEGRINLSDARLIDIKDDIAEIKQAVKTILVRNGYGV